MVAHGQLGDGAVAEEKKGALPWAQGDPNPLDHSINGD